MTWTISHERADRKRSLPASEDLGFGKFFAEHMLVADFKNGAWQAPRITPLENFSLSPAASVLHYGQALFEGMKAFSGKDGQVRLFRPDFHARRMSEGADRLCLPKVPEKDFIYAVQELVKYDRNWVPKHPSCSLYIRPTLIATEPFLGVRPAKEYRFFIINSPVGAYYKEGFGPVRIWVENEFVRASAGGTGAVKCSGNYAASLLAAERAKARGFSQVLWLDAQERKYVEEVGTMNIFFRFKDEVATPALEGTVLPGCTRDSVLQVLKEWSVKTSERRISLAEVKERAAEGELLEVFGTGTAAVISPVGELAGDGFSVRVEKGVGDLTKRLFDEISGIQRGERPDRYQWTVPIT